MTKNKILIAWEENQDWLSREEGGKLEWKLLVDLSFRLSPRIELGIVKIKPSQIKFKIIPMRWS